MKHRVIMAFISLLMITPVIGQTFSNDRDKFVKEFEKMMKQQHPDNLKSFFKEEFGPLVTTSSDFPDFIFNRLVQTSNAMIDGRLKAYPDVYGYVMSVYTLVKDKQPTESYQAWHNTVDKLLTGKNKKRIKDFLDVSVGFFENRVVASDPNFEWVFIGGDYSFTYEKEPFIEFSNGKLVCRTFNKSARRKDNPYTDSVVIDNTGGKYNMVRERLEGVGGTMYWEKVGLDKKETYAELSTYEVSFRSTNFSCDSVNIKSPYFDYMIAGKVIDRAQKGSISKNRSLPYPQFKSYESKYEIKELIKDVDYVGGFSLQGEEFVGEGTENSPASLFFHREGKVFVKTASDEVRISDKKLNAYNCGVTLYVGQYDSITHPSLDFSFIVGENEVLLTKSNKGLSQSPFVNSYHKLDMYLEQISWKRTESEIILGYNFATSQQQRIAKFESAAYYDEKLFQRLQGMERIHPLSAIWDYAYDNDKYVISEGDASTAMHKTIQQAKSTLLELSSLGFISYDTEKGIVVINEKLKHFVLAKSGKTDFDNIAFSSDLTPVRLDGVTPQDLEKNKKLRELKEKTDKRNRDREKMKNFGTIDLVSLDMNVQAVDLVPISNNKNTQIFPENNEFTIKENRSFHFKGWINSGKWEVKVLDGNYVYEKNGFNIFESDLALFRAEPMDPDHGEEEIPIQSPISGVRGELLVDDVNNRAGLKEEFQNYPRLLSKEKTRVYYDQKNLYLGAYDRDRFYFEIDPFEMDSLATFNEKYVRFDGELTSAGIFPKFRQKLKIMPDYSLGFSTSAPDDGYEFYGEEARYENKILLSNNGLQGAGSIEFVNSISKSKELFTFLPDSTIGVVEFLNKPQEEGVQFPDITGPDAFISYVPRDKILKSRSNLELLEFFDGDANLRGEAIIREDGIKGKGLMLMDGAQMTSRNYRFERWDMYADTATFDLLNKYKEKGDLTQDDFAFKTSNVKGHVDFKKRRGDFELNDGTSFIDFPLNQYLCKIDLFSWNMDDDEVEMSTRKDEDDELAEMLGFAGPNFFSTHPDQDSLEFRSEKSVFNMKEQSIYCDETDHIDVADARIYPDSARLIIRKDAYMEPLENAEMKVNFITQYHSISDVYAEITGKYKFTANGTYIYYDRDSTEFEIDLPIIQPDSSAQTIAKGVIGPDDGFKISPEFDFYGDVYMSGAELFLLFDGATRLNHNCERFDRNWMAFETYIDPSNIKIPVAEDMKDLEGRPISAGIVWRHSRDLDSVLLYPTFLSSIISEEDPIVMTASGYLQYDDQANEFQISNEEKLVNRGEVGNYISLHAESCSMNGDGRVDLGMDYRGLNVDAVGVVNYNQGEDKTTMNLTLKITAPINEKLFEEVAKKINKNPAAKFLNFNENTLEQALVEWVDQESADKIKSEFTLDKKMKRVPKELRDGIVITGLQLTSYNKIGDDISGLKSTSETASIVSIFGEPVMRDVPMKFFAEQRTIMGDRLAIMIDMPGGFMYFLDYDNRKMGNLNILTSDTDLRNGINDIKPDKRKKKKFVYQTTDSSTYKAQFLRIFND